LIEYQHSSGDSHSYACSHPVSAVYSAQYPDFVKEERCRNTLMSSNINAYMEEGLSKVSPPASSSISENDSQNSSVDLKAHDYIGLSEVSSSMESSVVSSQDGEENNMNLKETELRLGLPGSLSPARESSELSLLSPLNIRTEVEEKKLFPVEKQQHSTKDGVAEEKNGQDKYNIQPSGMGRNMMTVSPKTIVTGAKRGFSEAMESRNCFPDARSNGFSAEGKWVFPTQVGGVIVAGSEVELPKTNTPGKFLPQGLASAPGTSTIMQGPTSWHTGGLDHSGSSFMSSRTPNGTNLNGKSVKDGAASTGVKDITQSKMPQERPRTESQHGTNHNQIPSANNPGMAPAAKAQVVGWPPIRSFRKNSLAAYPKTNDEDDGKSGSSALYVKVSMDGAPYLRKVDLKLYNCYLDLSSALEKMFSCFTIGQCGSHGVPGRDGLSESKLMDLLHGSEYVLTYEDKDGDWMLVGDVPWEMFIDSCKRLRIMKGSEAIGLAPRAMEKCKNRN